MVEQQVFQPESSGSNPTLPLHEPKHKYIYYLRKKNLTNQEICDILDSKDVERQIEPVPSTETNSVVEGVNVYAPELNT